MECQFQGTICTQFAHFVIQWHLGQLAIRLGVDYHRSGGYKVGLMDPGVLQKGQKCHFWAILGHFGPQTGQNRPKTGVFQGLHKNQVYLHSVPPILGSEVKSWIGPSSWLGPRARDPSQAGTPKNGLFWKKGSGRNPVLAKNAAKSNYFWPWGVQNRWQIGPKTPLLTPYSRTSQFTYGLKR